MSSPLTRPSLRDDPSSSLYQSISYSLLIHAIIASALMMFSVTDGTHVKRPKRSYTVHLGKPETARRTPLPRQKEEVERPPVVRRTPTAATKPPPPVKQPKNPSTPKGETHDLLTLQRQSEGLLSGMQIVKRKERPAPAQANPPAPSGTPGTQPMTVTEPKLPSKPAPSTRRAAPKSPPGKTLARVKTRVDLNHEIQSAQRELTRLQKLAEPVAPAAKPLDPVQAKPEKPLETLTRRPENPSQGLPAETPERSSQELAIPPVASPESVKALSPTGHEAVIPHNDLPLPADTTPREELATLRDKATQPEESRDILVTARHFSQTMSSLLDPPSEADTGAPLTESRDVAHNDQPELVSAEPLLMRDIKIEVSSSSVEQVSVQLYRTMKVTSKGISTYDASRRDGTLLEAEVQERPHNDGSLARRLLSVTKADEGAYCLVIENPNDIPLAVDIVFRLYEGKDTQDIREFRQINVSPHSAQRFSFLMPYTVFWDDDSYFSGKMEDLRTITKFNYDTGIVWKRGKH